jgi:hypothetical protein
MRIGSNLIRRFLAGLWLSTLVLTPVSRLVAQTNTHSQVVYLPDPTPRPKDLELAYGHSQDDQPRVDSKAIGDRNTKRRELVEWAANELVTLSERLEAEASVPQSPASVAAAKANADKIAKLARSLTDALKAP